MHKEKHILLYIPQGNTSEQIAFIG